MSTNEDLEKRLFDLKLKMNKAKQLNNQAVLAEKKRLTDPKWHQKQQHASHTEKDESERDPADFLLHETAESVALRTRKRKSGEDEDFQYKAHEKRVDQMGFYPDAYDRQRKAVGEGEFYNSTVVPHKPSEDANDRLADSIKVEAEKRKKSSRRKVFDEEEEVQWINEANRRYTKQLDRAFGEYTREIKNSLERGTAI